MTDFTATITYDVAEDDGVEVCRHFEMQGGGNGRVIALPLPASTSTAPVNLRLAAGAARDPAMARTAVSIVMTRIARKTKGRVRPPTLGELEAAGVRVDRVKALLALEERETGIAFLETDSRAEITTSNMRWIRRIEFLGYRPKHVTVFLDAEIRLNDVPKSIIQLPARNRKDRSP